MDNIGRRENVREVVKSLECPLLEVLLYSAVTIPEMIGESDYTD